MIKVFPIGGSAVIVTWLLWELDWLGDVPYGATQPKLIVELIAHWAAWQHVIFGFGPLALAVVMALLARLGFLQRWFSGVAFRDFQKAHSQSTDLELVRQRLTKWHASRHPGLAKADEYLEKWSGLLWSRQGLWRCVIFAMGYPVIFLVAVWLITDNGTLGQAVMLPQGLPWVSKFAFTFTIVLLAGCAIALFEFQSTKIGIQDHPVAKIPIVALVLNSVDKFVEYVLQRLTPSRQVASAALYRQYLEGLTKLVIFGSLLAGLGLGVFAFSDAPTATIAVAASVAVVFAVAVFSAVVDAKATTGAFAVAGPMAVAFGFVVASEGIGVAGVAGVASAVIGAVAGAGALLFILDRFDSSNLYSIPITIAMWLVLATWLGAALWVFPQLPQWGITLKSQALHASKVSFCLIFFFCIAPLLNGLSDWVSVNLTRVLLGRYRHSSRRGAVSLLALYFWDLLAAILLTVGLYAALLGVLAFMQSSGWHVDVHKVLLDLQSNPWQGASQWLLLMAITNLLPTLVHTGLWWSNALWSRDKDVHTNLSNAMEAFESYRASPQKYQNGPLLGEADAKNFVYVLKWQKWVDRLMVLGLLAASTWLFTWLIPLGARVLLRWF